jgi:hypothetical protein
VPDLRGTPQEMIRILRELVRRGLIIKNFSLILTGGERGPLTAELNFTVARLVKHDEDSRKRYKYLLH